MKKALWFKILKDRLCIKNEFRSKFRISNYIKILYAMECILCL